MAKNNQTKKNQISKNEDIQEFLKLLMENRPEKGQDFAMLLEQFESMGQQLDAALHELHQVKAQLAEMQENPVKRLVNHVVQTVKNRIHTIQGCMADMKEQIIEGAKKAIANFKRIGVKGLDKVVSTLGLKKSLEQIQKDLTESIIDVKQSIGKIETIGQELRSVGGHIKNVGRTLTGKERQKVDGGKEGHFQSAVLSPLRLEKNILTKLNNLTLGAIVSIEHLEQAVDHAKENSKSEIDAAKRTVECQDIKAADNIELSTNIHTEKGKEKPSLLKELQEGKAARSVPIPEKERRMQEASL